MKRTELATYQDLLKRVHNLVSASDETVMSSEELRTVLDLLPGNGKM